MEADMITTPLCALLGIDHPILNASMAEIAAGNERADLAVAGVSAGVGAGQITSAQPAGEIVRAIVQEAEELLRQRPRLLLG
jgi:NAD(P)H-dependent flavin oxidoreductase YrpB (nitropropane dioxygenase family)